MVPCDLRGGAAVHHAARVEPHDPATSPHPPRLTGAHVRAARAVLVAVLARLSQDAAGGEPAAMARLHACAALFGRLGTTGGAPPAVDLGPDEAAVLRAGTAEAIAAHADGIRAAATGVPVDGDDDLHGLTASLGRLVALRDALDGADAPALAVPAGGEAGPELLQAFADLMPVPLWLTRPDGTAWFANRPAIDLLGGRGRRDPVAAADPSDGGATARATRAARDEGRSYDVEAPVRCADGVERVVRLRGIPEIGPGGRVTGYLVTAEDTTTARRDARDATSRIDALAAVARAQATAGTPAEAARAFLEVVMGALGAGAALLAVFSGDDELEFLATPGWPPELTEPFARFPLSADFPLSVSVRTGDAIWMGSEADWRARFPHSVRLHGDAGFAASAVLPLPGRGHTIGGMALSWTGDRAFGAAERAFLTAAATVAGQAMASLQAIDVEREGHRRALRAERTMRRFAAACGAVFAAGDPATLAEAAAAGAARLTGAVRCEVHFDTGAASARAAVGFAHAADLPDVAPVRRALRGPDGGEIGAITDWTPPGTPVPDAEAVEWFVSLVAARAHAAGAPVGAPPLQSLMADFGRLLDRPSPSA